MKKVLIVFPVSHQAPLVKSIVDNVSNDEISIDAFDIRCYNFYSTNQHLVLNKLLYNIYKINCNIPVVKTVFNRLVVLLHIFFDKYYLYRLISHYDIVDFHFLSAQQYPLIKLARRRNVGIKINFWGSDLFRVNPESIKQHAVHLKYASQVQLSTNQMYEHFASIFPQFVNKVNVCMFGNYVLFENRKYLKQPLDLAFLKEYHSSQHKIVVTCGYNGSKGQQHLKILQHLTHLPQDYKSRIHLIFPMTYGADSIYISSVRHCCAEVGCSFDIVDNHLTSKELCDLRRITDITVNIQITDALSGSLQEHLQCGNLLIVGDWLPYRILKDKGIFFLTTSVDDLGDNLINAINNLPYYKCKCNNNSELIYNLTSWETLAPKWRDIYSSI